MVSPFFFSGFIFFYLGFERSCGISRLVFSAVILFLLFLLLLLL